MDHNGRQGFAEKGGAVLMISLLIVAFVSGGASRADAASQLVIRSFAVIAGAIALNFVTPADLKRVFAPLLLIGVLSSLMLIQLVPLPPSIWTALPGREIFAQTAVLTGIQQPWRPISLVPDATLNSLLATLPALAAILCFTKISSERQFWLLVTLAVMSVASGLLGVMQISSRTASLYLYDVTNRDSGVGLFANRNHQAALLAMTLPVLTAIAAFPSSEVQTRFRALICIVAALFVLPLILVTGSRM